MKACIACKHFTIDFGGRGYSELTPGYPATVDCNKFIDKFDVECADQKYLQRNLVEIATGCPLFELSDTAIDMGWPAE